MRATSPGDEADILALWDSPRQREAYDWFSARTGQSAHRVSLGRRPAVTSTSPPPSPRMPRGLALNGGKF